MGSSISYQVYEDVYGDTVSNDLIALECPESTDFKDTEDEFYDAEDDDENPTAAAVTLAKGLDCSQIKNRAASEPFLIRDYKFLNQEKKIDLLNTGATFVSFSCHVGNTLTQREKDIVDSIANLSGAFEDETKENGVSHIDINDDDDASKYTVIVVKVSYLVPDVDINTASPELICKPDYISKCVPGSPYVWPDMPDDTTFRITKSIVPYVYSITIQLKVTELTEQADLDKISTIDDVPVDRAFILERTKRNKNATDATAKAKSLLTYKKVKGGLFVTNLTVVFNTSVPTFLAPFIDRLGGFGCKEASETCVLSRKYLAAKSKRDNQ